MIIILHYFIYIHSKQKMKDEERIQVFYIVWYVHRPFASVWMVTHFHLFMYLLLFVSIVTTITSSHLSLQFPLQQLQQHHRTQWSTWWATTVMERDEKMGCWYVNMFLYSYFFLIETWSDDDEWLSKLEQWWWWMSQNMNYESTTTSQTTDHTMRTQHQQLTMTTWAQYVVFCILLLASF